MRDWLSKKTATFIANNINNYEQISKIVSIKRDKPYRLFTKEDVIPILDFGCKVIYGEIIKFII